VQATATRNRRSAGDGTNGKGGNKRMTSAQRIHILSLAYGAHGVGKLDGKTIFVRGVVPGEEVEVVITEDHDRYAYADLVRVVTPSPDRRTPPCMYLPQCGGCPWQHVDYPAQQRAKERNLRDALERIGRWPDANVTAIHSAGPEYHYRGRLSLRTADRRVGFYAAGSHDLVPIERCMIAAPTVDAAIAAAQDLVAHVPEAIRRIEILACEKAGDVILAGEVEGTASAETAAFIQPWLARQSGIAGVVLHGRRWRHAWGRDSIVVRPEADVEIKASAGSFTQVNPQANRALVARVLELGAFTEDDRVLDLYAGIGNLSVPIARRARHVIAVEQNPLAANDARTNSRANRLGNLKMITATTRRALEDLVASRDRFEVIVLDPPRNGAAEAIDAIVALAPQRLVYVSCNPTTLARDLARLRPTFDFDVVEPVDLFPHSYHMETIARGYRRS